jgi:DNA-directed RNA polymerase subunit omega
MRGCFRKWRFPAQADSEVLYCNQAGNGYSLPLDFEHPWKTLNAELTKKALEKVGNPNILINLISRRVRQLNSGGGALSRPLLADVGNMGAADIALTEIVEGKMGFEIPEPVELTRPSLKKRGKKR